MSNKKVRLKHFIAEVSYDNRIEEYELVAENAVLARGLIAKHLAPVPVGMKFRLRDTPLAVIGEPRVLGRVGHTSP